MRTFVRNIMLLAMLLAGTTTIAVAADKNASTAASKYAGKVTHITKAEFDKRVCNTANGTWKYIGDKPCVIDFYATWCGPCKDQLYIYKIDIDKERELASMFGAYSIPLLIFVPQQGEPSAQRGALAKEDLETAIKKAVLGQK